jgi:integrase
LDRSFAINGKAKSTLDNYKRCLAHLALHYMCSPEQLNKESIDDYLFYCQNLHKTPSESFFKHTIFGLRAAYKVMGMTTLRVMLPKIERQKDLPVILSKPEVRALIASPKYLKHKLVIAMLYGCGLRNYELCNLERSDIDFDRNTVFVKKQKGHYDRYVPLSGILAKGLKKYFATENPYRWVFNSQVTGQAIYPARCSMGHQGSQGQDRGQKEGHRPYVPTFICHAFT